MTSNVKEPGKIIAEYNPMNIDDNQKNQMHRMTKSMALAFIRQK